jgi:hypothetical protein
MRRRRIHITPASDGSAYVTRGRDDTLRFRHCLRVSRYSEGISSYFVMIWYRHRGRVAV